MGKLFSGTLLFEGNINISWRAIDTENDRLRCLLHQEDNDDALAGLAILEEIPTEASVEHGQYAQELKRLDAKLNIIMSLLERLLAQSSANIQSSAVRLNTQFLQWTETDAGQCPAIGQLLYLEIYLRPGYPRPLLLLGHVLDVDHQDMARRISIEIDELPESTRMALEKFIFRAHRREIARRRVHKSR